MVTLVVVWIAVTGEELRSALRIEKGFYNTNVEHREVIRNYLRDNENDFRIARWHAPETLDGAAFLFRDGEGRPLTRMNIKKSGVAIRVEFSINEGFGKWVENDGVFLLNEQNELIAHEEAIGNSYAGSKKPWFKTVDFIIGKPSDRSASTEDVNSKASETFLKPMPINGNFGSQ